MKNVAVNIGNAAAKNYFPIHLTKAHLSKRRRRESFSGFFPPPPHFLRTQSKCTRDGYCCQDFSRSQHSTCHALHCQFHHHLSLPTSFRKASCLAWAAQPNPLPFHRRRQRWNREEPEWKGREFLHTFGTTSSVFPLAFLLPFISLPSESEPRHI